jgi:hypothetical protein
VLSPTSPKSHARRLGAVETLLVDIDAAVPGSVDDETDAIAFAPPPAAMFTT